MRINFWAYRYMNAYKAFVFKMDREISGQITDGAEKPRRKSFSTRPAKGRIKRNFSENGDGYKMPSKKRMFLHRFQAAIPTLPNKFLLGGNINDPLNLEEIGQRDQTLEQTPNSSPMQIPPHKLNVNVLLPKNITDPLNLKTGEDIEVEEVISKKKKKKKKKKKGILINDKTPSSSHKKSKKKNISDIVSPVIPQDISKTIQPGVQNNNSNSINNKHRRSVASESREIINKHPVQRKRRRSNNYGVINKPKFNNDRHKQGESKKFIYGNYNRYYGYRNPLGEHDYRLDCLKREWIENKDVLDIGCNTGEFTLAVANYLHPRHIVGIDIDDKLIRIARKNVRIFVSKSIAQEKKRFPISMALNYGPIVAPPSLSTTRQADNDNLNRLSNSVAFISMDYVPIDDEAVDLQTEEYDVILALSVTKWMHLNNGDSGLKRSFRRMYKQLRPEGMLILEPQAWPSYGKKKKIAPEIFKNYQSITFKPDQFTEYLLQEVGFTKCEHLNVPFNLSKGFRRDMQVYTKSATARNTPHWCQTGYYQQNTTITPNIFAAKAIKRRMSSSSSSSASSTSSSSYTSGSTSGDSNNNLPQDADDIAPSPFIKTITNSDNEDL